jgi:chloramphenicol-sensitive protein RarD
MQWTSVAIAAAGVLWLTFSYGAFPWIALLLAGSFALYGLLRKLVAVDAVAGLGVESVFLFLPALLLLGWLTHTGGTPWLAGWGTALAALLVFGGVLTALPLVGFAYAVRRVPLSLVGLMQYIAPTMQFLIGVVVFQEAFDRDRAIGFGFIWVALALFMLDGAWRARRAGSGAVAAEAVP